MSAWVLVVVVVVIGLVVARRWLPDRSGLADTAYDCYRALVPAPRPTVRVVTKRIARVCRRQRVVMPFGQKAVLPRAFLVGISPDEYAVVEPLLDTVQEAVGQSLLRTAREKQWLHDSRPRVVLQPSETVAEGRPEVISTTLPAPRPAGSDPLPPVSSREATLTVDVAPPTGPGRQGTLAPPERTRDVVEPTRTSPAALRAVGGRADLRPEPTAAELPDAQREHRLRTADGEPDIMVAGHAVDVGRSADCEVTIHYAAASRRHLRLTPTPAGCRLEDLGSRHGTRVNGVAVGHPVLLRARDTVQIGTMGPSWTYQPSYGAVVTPPLHEVR
ncbi:MAG: DUF3662 domain-containing protein [Geodermatophilaceae bacterium]|nr:DUF3662 domain-containing protein [Geodermatophilaceae bacterium]